MLFGQHANPKSFSQLTPDSALIRAQDTSLYLDQVEAMSPHLQNLLYHFIKTYQTQSHSRFPRLIFSTHVDLSQQVDQVKFSRNLYESCIRFTIQVPPLQKRLQDIRALSYYFMRLSMNRYGVWINHIQSTAIQLLEQYHWPHNIRQLEQVIEKAVLVAQSKHYIEAQHIQSILDEQPKHL